MSLLLGKIFRCCVVLVLMEQFHLPEGNFWNGSFLQVCGVHVYFLSFLPVPNVISSWMDSCCWPVNLSIVHKIWPLAGKRLRWTTWLLNIKCSGRWNCRTEADLFEICWDMTLQKKKQSILSFLYGCLSIWDLVA